MNQNEFNIKGYDFTFRVKKMNAIEVLAIRTQIKSTMDGTITLFNTILESLEVKCDNSWLPVKEKDQDIFYPPIVEDDVNLVQELVQYFMKEFLEKVFMKSNG